VGHLSGFGLRLSPKVLPGANTLAYLAPSKLRGKKFGDIVLNQLLNVFMISFILLTIITFS
jgi:hypothetical protein